MLRLTVVFLWVAACLARGAWADEVQVLGCHQAILPGNVGVLAADTDCSPGEYGRWGVWLTDGATLDLNGHALRGGFGGVYCAGRCKIIGPGEISDMTTACISIEGKTTVSEVDVHHCEYGIIGYDNYADGKARLNIASSSIHDHAEHGILAQTVRGLHVSVDRKGVGIQALRVRALGLDASANADVGVLTGAALKVVGLTAMSNGGAGVDAIGSVLLRDSVLTGNNGLGSGRDIISRTAPPHLIDTTCGRSALGDGTDWNVCAND